MDEEEKEKKLEEVRKSSHEKLGGFLYNLAQLVFAGLVVGGVSPIFSDKIEADGNGAMVVVGVCATIGLAFLAHLVIKNQIE